MIWNWYYILLYGGILLASIGSFTNAQKLINGGLLFAVCALAFLKPAP